MNKLITLGLLIERAIDSPNDKIQKNVSAQFGLMKTAPLPKIKVLCTG